MTREQAEIEVENVSLDEAVHMLMQYHEALQRIKCLGELVHYPDRWDTACYPTLESAIGEIVEILDW